VHGKEEIVIAINVADEARTVPLPIGKKAKAIFGNPVIDGEQVTIPARSGVVIK
jgi:flagellar biosynthesis regulator FlbT